MPQSATQTKIQIQYVVPVYRESKETEGIVMTYLRGLKCLSDRSGNLKDADFSTVNNQLLGEFILCQTLDEKVAKIVREELIRDNKLIVLPVKKVEYNTPGASSL